MQGGQQQQPDKTLDLFLLLGLLACGLCGLWYFHHAIIVAAVFRFRLLQGTWVLWSLEGVQACLQYLHVAIPSTDAFEYAMEYMVNTDPSTVTLDNFMGVSAEYGSIFKYISVFLGVTSGVYMIYFNALSEFCSTYTMAVFSSKEAVNWPQIFPVINKNLVKEDIAAGPWAMALRPLDFCVQKKLVFAGTTSDGKPVARLRRGLATETFCLQMGPLWEGLENLPPYVLALFACFAAKGNGDDKGCKKLLHQIARSTETGHLNFGGTRELLLKHVQNPKVGQAVGPHAYLYTVMASLLEYARNDGVLASAEFLWLKPLDRCLWFMLNTVGRQTPFCEVAGPVAHFKVEQRLRRPLKIPMIDEAVNALESALNDIIYRADAT